ncbi:MAG: hypothetical protein WKF68_10705 [Daejeonella sp.]
MKKVSVLLIFTYLMASVSAFAQTKPKSAPKPVTNKECQKGDSCCSGEAKTAKAAPKAPAKKI